MKKITTTLLASSLVLISSANAAVHISTVGGTGYDITGVEATAYYTSSVLKTYDVNGDNKYGTDGYYVFGGSGTNNNAEYNTAGAFASLTPSFVTSITADSSVTLSRYNSSQTAMDNPVAAMEGTDFGNAGYLMNNGTAGTTDLPMLSFAVTNSDAMTFRFGVLAGGEQAADGRYDPTALSLTFIGDGTTASVSTLPVIAADDLGMVFFDVTLDAGTTGTFTLAANERSQNATINGITFDVAAVPEPSSAVMLFGGLGGLILRRRRA
ncbi:PEP-CTERM sorting domain-containing protein [Rubritalea spongiae]|uniref:PEP-CTERM sorting domain-containing protein n=1 Tax=Rubritalea spongiae TaxID=430797 RepID=A0ABW5E2H3_9BACT